MKKSIRTTSVIAALVTILALSACGNKPAETTTTAAATTTTTAAATTTEAETEAPEATKAEDETDAEPAGTEAAPADDDTDKGEVMFTDLSGHKYYKADAVAGEWDVTFPYTSVRISTGLYLDSDTNPELFDVENFSYSGDRAGCGDLIVIKEGDTLGDLKIKSASTRAYSISPDVLDEAGNPLPPQLGGSSFDIDGDITLTGILRYYFDEMYAVASGDMLFVPDSCYAGMPMATDIINGESNYGYVSFDEKGSGSGEDGWGENTYGGGINVYSDTHGFHVGNLDSDTYAGRTDLVELFDGATANCTKKVQITLSDVHIEWNDNFGSYYSCSGIIKDASVIG